MEGDQEEEEDVDDYAAHCTLHIPSDTSAGPPPNGGAWCEAMHRVLLLKDAHAAAWRMRRRRRAAIGGPISPPVCSPLLMTSEQQQQPKAQCVCCV